MDSFSDIGCGGDEGTSRHYSNLICHQNPPLGSLIVSER